MFRFKCLFRLHVNKSIFLFMLLLLDEYQSMQFPTATKKSIQRIRWKLDKWKTALPLPRQNTGWPSIEDWEKIETNGFGGKCDAISSKNRGWLLTNERLCHLGQITQQINGKRKYMKSCCWLWKTMHPTERKILKKVKNAKHFLESHWKSDF